MMPRMILVWLVLSTAIGFGTVAWRSLSEKEPWELTKTAIFATMCALVAVVLLSFFVIMI